AGGPEADRPARRERDEPTEQDRPDTPARGILRQEPRPVSQHEWDAPARRSTPGLPGRRPRRRAGCPRTRGPAHRNQVRTTGGCVIPAGRDAAERATARILDLLTGQ